MSMLTNTNAYTLEKFGGLDVLLLVIVFSSS